MAVIRKRNEMPCASRDTQGITSLCNLPLELTEFSSLPKDEYCVSDWAAIKVRHTTGTKAHNITPLCNLQESSQTLSDWAAIKVRHTTGTKAHNITPLCNLQLECPDFSSRHQDESHIPRIHTMSVTGLPLRSDTPQGRRGIT
jgi:hypothetical protein